MNSTIAEQLFHACNEIYDIMLDNEFSIKQSFKLGRVECNLLTYLLQRQRPVMLRELAEYIHVSCSRITHLTDSLIKKGYITRDAGTKDRRVLYVQITLEGAKIAEDYLKKNVSMYNKYLKKLPPEHVEAVYSALNHWVELLSRIILNDKNKLNC